MEDANQPSDRASGRQDGGHPIAGMRTVIARDEHAGRWPTDRDTARWQSGEVMGKGISEVLTFAVGVAISPVPIIAVTLMLFSRRARVNGPLFLLGWVLALAVVSAVVYLVAVQGGAATSSTASDSIAWGKIVLGALLLMLALRNGRKRPAPGAEPEVPKWMAGIDALAPGKALGLGFLLAGVNPKNLILTAGAATGGGTARPLDCGRDRLAGGLRRPRQSHDRGPGCLLPARRRGCQGAA